MKITSRTTAHHDPHLSTCMAQNNPMKVANRDKEDEQRAVRKRQQDAERTRALLNSKLRTIGIDVESLEKQVEEKEAQRLEFQQLEAQEAKYREQLLAHMEEEETAELEARLKENQEVQRTLLEQMQWDKNNAPTISEPPELELCGASSAQCFGGEDADSKARTKIQQEQIKQWCAQQVSEKKQKECLEVEERMAYARHVLDQDEVLAEMERREAEERAFMAKSVQQYNREQAEKSKLEKMIQKQDDKADGEALIEQAKQSSFLTEDISVAQSALSPHRYRPDHFKGFDSGLVEHIYRENDAVLSERQEAQLEEREYEEEWDKHEASVMEKLEEAERDQVAQARENNLQRAIFLELQKKELLEKQRQSERDRFGEISVEAGGLFANFGTSLS